ncbi:restriction endonuclease subunit S [Novosphingobium sp. AP12]|uniref:restriction endonuclease subunit S n=1 Tax=Novosphingobium sp. AP12 TaxID=1144305 RepID=UPI000271F6B0|nr:restriction endonuclease subunit S [Novosphingobium sp. AP12]EJL22923.1 restriction endonuclease S subunit [Novosphingobium sp. AP12]
MSDLPEGWAGTTIGEICDLVNGKAFKPSDWSAAGLPIVRIQNLNRPDTKFNHFDGAVGERFLIEDGDLLFAWSGTPGTSFGAHIWNGPKAVLNQHIFNVRFDRNAIDRNFLRHAINQTLDEQIAKAHGGVGLRHVTKGKFEETGVPIPPFAEQRRIVAKIDSLTGKSRRARDHLDHIPRLVEKYKQAILAAAFRGDLTREWRSQVSKGEMAWETHELGNIADIGTGATPKRGRAAYFEGGTIAWVTSGAVNQGIVMHADEYITPAAIRETNCKVYPAGTLLMAMYGEGKTRGKVASLGIEAATNQALASIKVHPQGPAETNFVLWYLRSQYLNLREQAAGGVQPNLNLGIIKRTSIGLPSSSEQKEIVRRIEAAFTWIERLTVDATSAHKLINRLDQSVLAKAFRGQLVPQDPADEPATALLERIRAERAAAPKAKRGRKMAA